MRPKFVNSLCSSLSNSRVLALNLDRTVQQNRCIAPTKCSESLSKRHPLHSNGIRNEHFDSKGLNDAILAHCLSGFYRYLSIWTAGI